MPELSGLNPQQRDAVTTTAGPVLVLAGAGTGKTRVVTTRIAYLLEAEGVPAENVVAVTFTNRAAGEMKDRLRALLRARADLEGLIVSTFHSLCVRILRADAERLGYRPHFTICDGAEQNAIVRRALRDVAGLEAMRPEDILAAISRLKQDGVAPRQFLRTAVEERDHTIGTVYRKYQEALRVTNCMDFDDLLLNALQLLRVEAEVREHWQERVRYLLVDEFQDTNDSQFELVRLLVGRHGNLCVVGDDDQSIYAWRGAEPRHIVSFAETFRGTRTIRLEQNYRSVNTVLQAANALIGNNEDRVGKTLWSALGDGQPIEVLAAEDCHEEAERVVGRIAAAVRRGAAAGDHAILIRTNLQSRPFEEELRAGRLPYVVIGGTSFYDRKEVRDVMAYLTVLANPAADAALLRVANTPSRGLGGKSLERLAREALARKMPLRRMLAEADRVEGLAAVARRGAAALSRALDTAEALLRQRHFAELVETLLVEVEYEREVEHLYSDPLDAAAHLEYARDVGASLCRFLEGHAAEGVAGFLQQMALQREEEPGGEERAAAARSVKIITLHSAKGLEFPCVTLAGLQQGILPHKNALADGDISEERRLCYVGITRAQRELTLSYAQQVSRGGKTQPVEPSCFLGELPEGLLRHHGVTASEDEALEHLRAIRAALG